MKLRARNSMVCLLVMVLSLSLLAGCSKKEEPKQQDNQVEDQKDSEKQDTADDFFPLEETGKLSMWLLWSNDYIEDYNDLPAVQKFEQDTNVHVDYTSVTIGEAQEKFGLMMASGDYPDIVKHANAYYVGGPVQGVEDGVFIDMTDVVEQYMPNYKALRAGNEQVRKETCADDGSLPCLWTLATNNGVIEGERMWLGMTVRKDWLEEQNMEEPHTLEQWHDYLVMCRDVYGADAPLVVEKTGVDFIGSFTTAFGVYPGMYQENGIVKYGPLEEGYREFIELFRDWYAEGLIDKDFVSSGAADLGNGAYIATGRSGATCTVYAMTADFFHQTGYTQEEDFYLLPVTAPVRTEGDTPQTAYDARGLLKESINITNNCKNVELAARWLDYFYAADTWKTASYGIEGESYIENADGSIDFTDLILQNPDGYTPNDAVGLYTVGTAGTGLYNWAAALATDKESEQIKAQYKWNENASDLILPASLSLTSEESTTYNQYFTDCKTMVDEMTVKFIMGTEPMENYDNFVESLKSYGIQNCIDAYQAAMDRYNKR